MARHIRRFLNNCLLNGAFFVEILLLSLASHTVKVILSEVDSSRINEILLIIFLTELVLINILFSFSRKVSSVLKTLQYMLLIEIGSYYVIYTIALIVINSGINWDINTFGVFMLSWVLDLIVVLCSYKFTENNKIAVILLILSHMILILLFSLAIAIDIRNYYHCDFLYLIGSLSVLVLLSIFSYVFRRKINISRYFKKLIQSQAIDIFISFLFLIFLLLFLAACLLECNSFLKRIFNEWIPLLSLSISIGAIMALYLKNIKEMVIDPLMIYYFIFWAVVPIILFILFLQKDNIGDYTTFKGLLGIILAIDACVLLAFSKDMKVLLPKFENEDNLTEKSIAPYTIAKLKLILSNITVMVTFLNTIFSKREILTEWVDSISNIFYKISILMNKYIKNNNLETIFSSDLFKDPEFKVILFMFGLIGALLLLSEIFFRIEKWIFIRVSYRRL